MKCKIFSQWIKVDWTHYLNLCNLINIGLKSIPSSIELKWITEKQPKIVRLKIMSLKKFNLELINSTTVVHVLWDSHYSKYKKFKASNDVLITHSPMKRSVTNNDNAIVKAALIGAV